jgi:THO complex subunit 2
LLKVGDWTHAEMIISNLPTYYAVSNPRIAAALCNLIHITMDPIHRK